ncbi:indoleacetamide hydrolase [Paraburkholderia sediminicola]|uniref:indoleacetamide hydrolase n=1 Tax=Paraburkholderia sediminicola TaxID=458836 RepID=UPI0038B73F89
MISGCAGRFGLSPRPSLSVDQQVALTATEALQAMQDGTLTSEAYVTTLLARANALKGLNSWIALNTDGALAAARKIDAARAAGRKLGPLAGLPIYVKDNIDAEGFPTTAGTPALKHLMPAQNAPTLQRLLDAGAIVLAKANMHELAFGSTSTNVAFGFVQNPYDRSRVPGGSSGGTGAGIAARIVPAGLGTDTGASVRHPASFCGIAALRPSVGSGGLERRYSGARVVPISRTRDTVGPMGRSIADIAILDAIITGTAVPTPAPLAGLRLGLPKSYFWENLDDPVRQVAEAAVDKLRAAGVQIIEADLDSIGNLNQKVSLPVAFYEAYRDIPLYLKAEGSTITLQQVIAQIASPDVRGIFAVAAKTTLADYTQAMAIYRPQLIALYSAYFAANRVDGIIFPTVPIVPPPIDPSFGGTVSINGVPQPGGRTAEFSVLIRNVDPASNAGLPGLAFPAGLTPSGLPIGLEIDGPLGSDKRLLSIGLSIEALLGRLPAPNV